MSGILTYTRKKRTGSIVKIPINDIFISDENAYSSFNSVILKQISSSITKYGIDDPFLVKKTEHGYNLKSDAESFLAAKMAGIETVPCIISEDDKSDAGIIEQIKNIQEYGCDFFKEAEAIEKLISKYGMTQEDAALHLGKAQSTVANKLRLLRLTEEERQIITEHHLTERHARALLRLASPDERMCVLDMVIQYGFNVEKTELAVDKVIGNKRPKEAYRKRTRSVHSVRSYVKTIMKAVDGLKSSGIDIEAEDSELDDFHELRLRIPNSIHIYNKIGSEKM